MGIALGLTLGLMGFAGAFLAPTESLGGANRWLFALVISQAVTAICLWGTLVGSMLPLVFRRMGIDPAYASSPFVATFVDVTGILILFLARPSVPLLKAGPPLVDPRTLTRMAASLASGMRTAP